MVDIKSKQTEFLNATRWNGVRKISVVERDLQLDNLAKETRRCLRWIRSGRREVSRVRVSHENQAEEIEIRAYEGLRMHYPTVHDPNVVITEIARCTEQYMYWQNNEWTKPRYDTVLIRYDKFEGEHTMANRRVARLLLLFSTIDPESGESLKLAFVQLFRTVGTADPYDGMYKVKKEEKYEVIEIDTIERGVHLIPQFSGHDTPMATPDSPPALDVYTDFLINNHIDAHMYNTIY